MSEHVTRGEQEILDKAREMLSPMQRSVLLEEGNRLVTACPGAGKTRSISARASLLAARGDRVALTSYTNVGADEMARCPGAKILCASWRTTLRRYAAQLLAPVCLQTIRTSDHGLRRPADTAAGGQRRQD